MRRSIFLFLFIPFMLFSDEVKSIKLEVNQAVSKALQHNFTLKNEKIELVNKTFLYATVWNNLMPDGSLSFSLGKSYSTKDKNSTTLNSIGLGASVSLSLKGEHIYNIINSYQNYKKEKITFEQVKNSIIVEVKKYYYELIVLKTKLELLQKRVDTAKSRYDAASLKYSINSISESDKLKSEYDYKKLVYEMNQTRTNYFTELYAFKNLLGFNTEEEIELISDLPDIKEIDYEKLLLQGIDKNFEIQLLLQEIKLSKSTKDKYIFSFFPSFNLGYSYSKSVNYEQGRFNSLTEDDWNNSNSFSFSVNIPLGNLLPFSSLQTTLITAINEINKAKNNLLLTKERVKSSVITNINQLRELEANMLSLETNLKIAESSYLSVEKLYQSGSKSYLELKDAENDLFEANATLLDARYQYITVLLDTYYILNIGDFNL